MNAARPELDEALLREILKALVHFLDKSHVGTSEVITQLLTAPRRGSGDPAGWPHGSTQLRTFGGNRCGPGYSGEAPLVRVEASGGEDEEPGLYYA